MAKNEIQEKIDAINARCASDVEYRARLSEDYQGAMREVGIDDPLAFMESVRESRALADEDLSTVSGGAGGGGFGSSYERWLKEFYGYDGC